MNVLLINAVCGIRSTGRICVDIAQKYENEGHNVKIAYGREAVPVEFEKYAIRIGSRVDVCFHALMSKVFDQRGLWSRLATKRFLRWADKYDPDVLWLHNIHDYFINIELLFKWISSRPAMKVYWTQHDCWAFTGGCMHFMSTGCENWKENCSCCMNNKNKFLQLPLVCRSEQSFSLKKRLFSSVKDMTLIAPSEWMANAIRQSSLSDCEIIVKKNTVDTDIFKPTASNFKVSYSLTDKKIVLGVASAWSEQKGLYDFYNLANLLSPEYAVVLVGLNNEQMKKLPHNIVGIKRTNSLTELAEIYSAADVFVNLTYSDTYPTVNLEARACNTKIITYNTGGSPESAGEDAVVVPTGDINAVLDAIYHIT